MSFYNTFETDKNLENGAGVVLDYGVSGKIKIHRAGGFNQKYARVASAKLKPYARQLQTGTSDPDVIKRVMAEIYAEAVIIGWEGVKDKKGKALPYSKENVVKLMLDLPDLFEEIQKQAENLSNFRSEQLEDDAKNSPKS